MTGVGVAEVLDLVERIAARHGGPAAASQYDRMVLDLVHVTRQAATVIDQAVRELDARPEDSA